MANGTVSAKGLETHDRRASGTYTEAGDQDGHFILGPVYRTHDWYSRVRDPEREMGLNNAGAEDRKGPGERIANEVAACRLYMWWKYDEDPVFRESFNAAVVEQKGQEVL